MCRFLVYKGQGVVLADLIIHPKHSLINQSIRSMERSEPLNGDGFGVGWYTPELNENPCIFTSVSPAWSNRNLHRISDSIRSPLIFAHVRAATEGLFVSDFNCHPFQCKHLMWMHNGVSKAFFKIRRRLRDSLRDDLYNFIQGTTDSEHAFALFLNQLPEDLEGLTPDLLKDAMIKTIDLLNTWTRDVGVDEPSHYNFAVTDGEAIVISRYTDSDDTPESLYYTVGERFECEGDMCHIVDPEGPPKAVIIASEKLTNEPWRPVPSNHVMVVNKDLGVEITPIKL